MAIAAIAFALPLPTDVTRAVSVAARVLLAVCGVAGIAMRIVTSSGRQRVGWCLFGLPIALAPLTLWLTPDDLMDRGDLAYRSFVSVVAQPITLVAVLLLVPENARSIRSAGWMNLVWPFPILLGSLWVTGIDPVLGMDELSPTAKMLLVSSPVMLAAQEVLFLAPTPSRSSVTTSSARLMIVLSMMIGITQVAFNMELPGGGAMFGGVTDLLGLCTLALILACVIVHRPASEANETLAVATRARVIMPIAIGAGVVLRLGTGVGVGDAFILLGVIAAVAFLGRTIAEREELVRSLSRQASTDALTGLANRAALRQHLDEQVRSGASTSVVYLDLDDFKMVNDELGHSTGDELLKTTARRLVEALPATSLLARVGGDEFVAVVPRGPEAIQDVASEMIARLSAPIEIDGTTVEPRGSAGISCLAGDPDRAIDEADMALYAAKRDRSTRVRTFDESMRIDAHRRHHIDGALPAMLENGLLSVAYQPIVDLATGRWVGVEALVRWPRSGGVSARDIVEACERLRLGDALTIAVLQRVATDLPRLRSCTGLDLFCSVNVALQTETPQRLPAALASLHREHPGLQPVDLVLEITERQLPDDFAALADMLGRLRLEGYRVAIDDFGAGYSALAQLSRLSFDLLKLDSAFTDDLPVGLDLIDLVVELCHGRGAQVVAEGIEHIEQLEQFRATSCDLGQGYLWLRPLRIDEITAIDDLGALAGGSRSQNLQAAPRSG
ncbi:MAG: putative bifunctional diguanylate cyclase/phosphodiesterase [Acidimicrobiales bacterium]